MPDSHTQQAFRYSAFISYSHLDSAFARRLHRRLETYRLPRHVAQGRADATRRLKPIFRDRDELSAAPDLSAAVREAIAEAPYLIVICSQHAQNSAWVAREVALFRQIHGNAAVLAVLLDGCTDDHLRAMLGARTSAGHDIEPLAADFRRHGDGNRLAFLKLVAVLAGVRLDQLIQRDAQRRVRQIAISGISACIGLAALAGLTVMAVQSRFDLDYQRNRARVLINKLMVERDRAKAAGRLDIPRALTELALDYFASLSPSELYPTDSMQLAGLLQESGEDDEKRGDYEHARSELLAAETITGDLIKAEPSDTKTIYAHAQSVYWVGYIAWRMSDYAEADRRFHAYETLVDRLVDLAPENTDWLIERGYARSNLGMFFLRHKIDLVRAEPYFALALKDFQTAEIRRRGDSAILLDIADGYGWLGDVRRLHGDCDGARAERIKSAAILSGLQARDDRNAMLRIASNANSLGLARADLCRGAWRDAIDRLHAAYGSAKELSDLDPENIDLRRKMRILQLFEALAWMKMPVSLNPNSAVNEGTLGDCNADRLLPHNEELAEFCFILQARQAALVGNQTAVSRSLAAAKALQPPVSDQLSPRWGLNFAEETKASIIQKKNLENQNDK